MRVALYRWWIMAVLIGILAVGCTAQPVSLTPVAVLVTRPVLYSTRTPPVKTLTVTPTVTQTALPTPTQVIYTVARNDTLIAIADRFGITVDVLLAANPGVIPQALAVGQTLIIPSAGEDNAVVFTPEPVDVGESFCQLAVDGLTCMVPIQNPGANMMENIRLLVTVLDENGTSIASEAAVLPLNILPAGQVLPAGVFFRGLTSMAPLQVEILSATSLEPADGRYLKTEINNLLTSTSWNGLTVNLQGDVFLLASEKPASRIWLVAVAFSAQDQVVGFRRWEWDGLLQPGESQEFSLPVYSLGPAIQHVEIVVEARP